jgi:hypothetical protein
MHSNLVILSLYCLGLVYPQKAESRVNDRPQMWAIMRATVHAIPNSAWWVIQRKKEDNGFRNLIENVFVVQDFIRLWKRFVRSRPFKGATAVSGAPVFGNIDRRQRTSFAHIIKAEVFPSSIHEALCESSLLFNNWSLKISNVSWAHYLYSMLSHLILWCPGKVSTRYLLQRVCELFINFSCEYVEAIYAVADATP